MKICTRIVGLLLCAMLVFALASSLFIRAGRIVGVEYDNDIYIIEDHAGLVWVLEGVEDLSCGDYIAMLMWNRLTPWTIFDDVVLKIA